MSTSLVGNPEYRPIVLLEDETVIATSAVFSFLTKKDILRSFAELAMFTFPELTETVSWLPAPIMIPSSLVIRSCPLISFGWSFRTYLIAGTPVGFNESIPNESEFDTVTLNFKFTKLPALNPGLMSPVNPVIAFFGVNESLENIPSNIPLVYRYVITRV